MRSSAWLRAALLASSVHATLVAQEDGSVTAIQSMARKHFGRRSVELDVTGARLVIIAQEDDVEPSAADYGGAVVLIKPRPACACLSVSAHALHSRSATSPRGEYRRGEQQAPMIHPYEVPTPADVTKYMVHIAPYARHK